MEAFRNIWKPVKRLIPSLESPRTPSHSDSPGISHRSQYSWAKTSNCEAVELRDCNGPYEIRSGNAERSVRDCGDGTLFGGGRQKPHRATSRTRGGMRVLSVIEWLDCARARRDGCEYTARDQEREETLLGGVGGRDGAVRLRPLVQTATGSPIFTD